MSYSFQARFDTTPLTLPQMMNKLPGILDELGIRFQNTASRLIGHKGWPTIDASSFEPVQAQGIEEVGRVAAQWWGVGLYCVSQPLMQRLGRGDWVEVDLQFFRAPNKRWTMSYRESKTAYQHRIEAEDAAQELYALQLRLCSTLGFRFSVYDEEDYDLPPIPTLNEVEHRIERYVQDRNDCSLVVSNAEMTFDRARQLAGRQAGLVRMSTTSHILFPFLRVSD